MIHHPKANSSHRFSCSLLFILPKLILSWILNFAYKVTFVLLILISLSFNKVVAAKGSFVSEAKEAEAQLEDRLLEEKVLNDFPALPNEKAVLHGFDNPDSIDKNISILSQFRTFAEKESPRCKDERKTYFGNKYVLTWDETGKPCRIYDLSFPNLKMIFSNRKSLQVPVQKITSGFYLNWLNGKLEDYKQKSEAFNNDFNPRTAAKNSWISKLKFRKQPIVVPGSKSIENQVGLPRSFRLSDLDIGENFKFDSQTKIKIQNFISETQGLQGSMSFSVTSFTSDFWLEVLNKPETLLQGIRFDWNDLKKVYEVVLDGDFLPLSGPVPLVDYQRQYKYAVDRLFRSILESALTKLAQLIPTPMISNIVQVLVNDLFEQVELAYDYQILQLEDSLRAQILLDSEPETWNQGLNILFGQQSDLVSKFVLDVVQGKQFDWESFDKMGRISRYNTEKQRDIMKGKMNSKLVQKTQCDVEFVHDHFAICSKAGKKEALYSLISEQVVFSKSFGAPLIYRYQRPYETSLLRGISWTLSVALRVMSLPISKNIIQKLDSILKNYMITGLRDEALLRNHLYSQPQALGAESALILDWLYIQNLNFFLPKSLNSERNVIEANKNLLN